MSELVVWLASYPYVRLSHGKGRYSLGRESLSEYVGNCLPDFEPHPSTEGCIFGLARLSFPSRLHRLLRLSASVQEQVDFYQNVLERSLLDNGEAFLFNVIDAKPLSPPAVLQNTGLARRKGMVIELDVGQPESLRDELLTNGCLPTWMPTPVTCCAIRIPEPHAVLLSTRVWS